ncbi:MULTISPECIES: DUF448 domain-containing protein [Sphingomonas]|uniref:DUF448 domain-containing protein n=1 Tax=Edaphosphingomonas fennica TaxID=114404 RepID=A0A2T4I7Z0_9SPHN|nr:DUF448 domain-containing protein [Sphingomonas sp. MM-1]AGH49253.1 hypothetical protein G432_07640 [Sphingomonas sp. MM-1]PTD27590.1 DUF448 domain-containing protein [Sphingomonas fennica]
MASNEHPSAIAPTHRPSRAKPKGGPRAGGKHAESAPDAGGEDVVDTGHGPERRCVLSGDHGPRDGLIRLALGPDGTVAPDVRAKAGGRGAWIAVDRVALETAIAKGKLKGALARAFKTASFLIPDDLPAQIERALERAALDRLGLEARAGNLVTGSERIVDAARKGTVALLLHARDAAADGTRKLDQALRVGLDMEGTDTRGLVIPASRAILSMALGRENVVHIALVAPAAAARVSDALGRWRGFIGRNGSAEPCDTPSQGPSALRN